MSLTVGNETHFNQNPNGGSYSWSHTQNAGSDKALFVSVMMPNTTNFGAATYNGVAMTQVTNWNGTSLGQRWRSWILLNPPDGANSVLVNFSGSQFNPSSFYSVSFTNCSGAGNTGTNGGSATPNSQNLTVSDDSIVYAAGISTSTFDSITVDGVMLALTTANTNRQVAFGLSGLQTAGSVPVVTDVINPVNVTNFRVEIQSSGSPPPPTVQGSFFMLL
jgi:hypothetical protein